MIFIFLILYFCISVDFRIFMRKQLYSMSVGELTVFLYPRMFALHSMPENAGTPSEDGSVILPPWERLLNHVSKLYTNNGII